jgi:hypothetical protein
MPSFSLRSCQCTLQQTATHQPSGGKRLLEPYFGCFVETSTTRSDHARVRAPAGAVAQRLHARVLLWRCHRLHVGGEPCARDCALPTRGRHGAGEQHPAARDRQPGRQDSGRNSLPCELFDARQSELWRIAGCCAPRALTCSAGCVPSLS